MRSVIVAAMVLVLALATGDQQSASAAAYETGAYLVVSPMGGTARYVTSPPRFHDGCEPYTTSYYDTPKFDDGTCVAGLPTAGQWALDMQGSDNDFVYIDINPGAIDGIQAGSWYRVVAGTQGSWGGTNGGYQYFGIHTWNPSLLIWENYAWIGLGHIDNLVFSAGTVIAGPTTSRVTAIVGQIAPQGIWAEHLHVEVSNNFGSAHYSRPYNWDGPENANDTTLGSHCNRSGTPGPYNCNAQIRSSDVLGYVGGRKTSWIHIDNPYYVGF